MTKLKASLLQFVRNNESLLVLITIMTAAVVSVLATFMNGQ